MVGSGAGVRSARMMDRRGYAAGLGAHLLWGLAPLYWRLVSSISAGQLTALRFVQALVLLVAYQWLVRRRSPRDLLGGWRSMTMHFVAGVLLAINWLVFVYAVTTDHVLDLSLGYFINPLVSVLLGWTFLGERLTRRSWIAVSLSAAGVGILAFDAGSLPWIALAVAAAFGLYGLVRKLSNTPPVEGVTIEMMSVAPAAIAWLALLAANGTYRTGDGSTFALTFLIGIITAAPLLLFAQAARTVPLWALGLLQYIGPSVQFLLGVVVFREPVDPMRMVGFGVIWIGLIVFSHATWPRQPRPSTAGLAA